MVRSVITPLPGERARGASEGAKRPLMLRPGETVKVRSEAEILATLDESLCLDSLPFMEEMRKYCNGYFPVLRRVNKIIVEGRIGLRRMRNAAILSGVTCDGSGHDGCQYRCPLLWREEWLKKDGDLTFASESQGASTWPDGNGYADGEPYSCQATSLYNASSPLPFWHVDQYLWDIREGVFDPRVLARTWFIVSYNKIRRRLGMKKRYLFHGECKTTPTCSLHLRPGELVRVKSRQEIAATLDSRGRNRGLGFTQEMLGSCGKTYRVLTRMEKLIVETTGKMQETPDTVLLEGAFCKGEAHLNCQRRCRSLWKEIWLERV